MIGISIKKGDLVKLVTFLLTALIVSGYSYSREINFSIFSVNDFHGNIQADEPVPGFAQQLGGQPLGGAEYLSGHLKKLSAGRKSIFLGVGDLVGASPIISSLTDDQATFQILYDMGMTYSALGNHELDRGYDWLSSQYDLSCMNNISSEKCKFQLFNKLNITYLAANVSVKNRNKKNIFKPYVIDDSLGIRVALIGLVTADTPRLVSPSGIKDLEFENEVGALKRVITDLKSEAIDIYVVLLHEGGSVNSDYQGRLDNSTPSCNILQGSIRKILDNLPEEVDVLFTGHTHQEYVCNHNKTLVVQGAAYGTRLSEVFLSYDQTSKVINTKNAVNHLVTQDSGVRDQAIAEIVNVAKQQSVVRSREVIFKGSVKLDRKRIEKSFSSLLGNVVADLMQMSDAVHKVDFALMNPGGLRNDLYDSNGDLTYGSLYSVQPFGNDWVLVTLSGQEIIELLKQQWVGRTNNQEKFFQVSKGLKARYSLSSQGWVIDSILINDIPVDLGKNYSVIVNSFILSGGDGFSVLSKSKNHRVLGKDIDLFTASIRKNLKSILDLRGYTGNRQMVVN